VIRISLVPFDLGASDRQVCRESLEGVGYSLAEPSAMEARTLGPRVERYSHQSRDWDLYVDEDGFGVARLRHDRPATFGDTHAVAAHLVARRKCHRDHRRGTADLCKEIELIRRQVLSRVQLTAPKGFWNRIKWTWRGAPKPAPQTARQGLWEGVPYVFSFFLLERAPGALTDDEKRCLRAVTEPSLIDEALINQGRVELIADEIASLPILGLDEALADIDESPGVTAHATWAGLAVMHGPGQATETEEIYVSLEACVQLAWSAAFFARRWCERQTQAGAFKVGEVEELRRSALSAARRPRRISDAAIPTRLRAILAKMAATSGLDEEVEHAEAALAKIARSLAATERLEQRLFQIFAWVMVGLLAATQIFPLLHEGPLTSLPTEEAIWWTVRIMTAVLAFGVIGLGASRRHGREQGGLVGPPDARPSGRRLVRDGGGRRPVS